MSNEQQKNGDKKSNIINSTDSSINEGDNQTFHEKPSPIQKANDTNKSTDENKYKMSEETIQRGKWGRADKIAFVGVIVNSVLTLLTLGVVVVAWLSLKKSSEDSKTSNDNFIKTLKVTQDMYRADSLSADATQKLAKNSDTTTIISSNSFKAQINSLKETQKEFEIANTPYFECTGFKFAIDSFKSATVKFNINNLGVQTEKILSGGFRLYFSGFHNDFDIENMKEILPDKSLIDKYIVKENPVPVFHEQLYETGKSIGEAIKNNKGWYNYFFGDIIYMNEATEKKREYLFYIRFRPEGGYDVIKNENRDLN